MNIIKKFLAYCINLIFPNVCGICDKIYQEDLCPKCEIKLNKLAKIKVNQYTNKNFKKHFYVFLYEGLIKERLVEYKFHQKNYIYKAIVKFMLKNKKICSFLKNYDIIIPVPIHNKRRLKRGYNQSALIAKKLAEQMNNLVYAEDVLFKIKNNKPQSKKNKADREKNVQGVYSAGNISKIRNKRILLLDDIYTTGNTVNECARMLKEAGVKQIDVISIAKD